MQNHTKIQHQDDDVFAPILVQISDLKSEPTRIRLGLLMFGWIRILVST